MPWAPVFLTVDDLPETLDLLQKIFAQYIPEATVHAETSGEQALQRALELRPDLVITDAVMPGLDGFELCRRIKSHPEIGTTPVLIVSGVHTNAESRIAGLNVGADGYLCKPFKASELMAEVQALLRVKRYEDRLREQERKLASELAVTERHLQESEEKYRTLTDDVLENSNVGTLILNSDFRVVWANKAVQTYLGLSRDDCIGHDMRNLIRDRINPVLENPQAFAAQTLYAYEKDAVAQHFECHVLPVFGLQDRWLDYCSQPIRTGLYRGGRMEYFNDITALKLLQGQLLQSQKMEGIGRLAGGIAHDFNNLLTSILGFSHFILDELPPGDPMRASVDEIILAGKRAEKLTRQLLVFGRKQIMQVRTLDVNRVVEEMHTLLLRTLGEDVTIDLRLCQDPAVVEADESQLEQIIMNLCVNARDAMPRGGRIHIRTDLLEEDALPAGFNGETACGPQVLLEIEDSGCGMTEEVRQLAFEPFFTTKEQGKGTGLGLAIVYSIVQQFGGSVQLQTSPGEGARFQIILPRSMRAPPPAVENGTLELPRGTETILVVEDEDAVRNLTVRLLDSLGYKVLQACDGQEGLSLCEKHAGEIDLVFTDVVMPRMGGGELARRLKAVKPMPRMLFTSGFAEDVLEEQDILFSGNNLVLKPYTRATLATSIRRVLSMP